MSALLHDIRSGLRIIRMHPCFTAVIVIVLALGIGANTTILGVVNAMLFFPMPYEDPDRLVTVTESSERVRGGGPTSYATFLDWRSQNRVFSNMAVFAYEAANLADGDEPERVSAIRVSDNALQLLGAKPALGQGFQVGEFVSGGDRAVLLSYGLWQRRFGARPDVVGRSLMLNGQSHTIVGVLPASLKMGVSLGFEPALWMPLIPAPSEDRGTRSCLVLARLGPGISMPRARADMEVISRRIGEAHPDTNRGWTAVANPLRPEVDTVAYVLLALLVCSILGLVCANVANLLLARAASREREIAVRAALGASRVRLTRQLLTENLLLLLIGCGLGVLMAAWACDLISSLFADTNLGSIRIGIDFRVLAATMVLFLLAGMIVGLVPAFQLSEASLSGSLKEGDRSVSAGLSKRRFKSFLVASEMALSLVLLMAACLAAKSWLSLWNIDLGFSPAQVLTMRISLTETQYPDDNRRVAFYRVLLERLQARPMIQSAAVASALPTASPERSFRIAGGMPAAPGEGPHARLTSVSYGYFDAMTIPVKAGRHFTEQDVASSPAVAVVNASAVPRYWDDRNPIGSRIEVAGRLRTIVGVVGDVRSVPLSLKAVPEIYLPFTQAPGNDMALIVQTALPDPLGVASTVKQEVRAIDPGQPVSRIMTMEQACSSNMGVINLGTAVLGIVSLGALTLAAVGIYGVLSFSVSQRIHEIGVRMALGARPRDLLRLVIRQGMTLTVLGIIPGLAVSLALGRVLSSSLYGVEPVEFVILAGISLLLTLVSLLACYVPAHRAASVDPIRALRAL